MDWMSARICLLAESDASPWSLRRNMKGFHLGAVWHHTDFRVVPLRPVHHSAVREHDPSGAIRRIEAHHNVAVTGQILGGKQARDVV
jgi:hypothetical protein